MRLIEISEQGQLPEDVPMNDFLREIVDEVVPHYGCGVSDYLTGMSRNCLGLIDRE
jgi:hypothetical protein